MQNMVRCGLKIILMVFLLLEFGQVVHAKQLETNLEFQLYIGTGAEKKSIEEICCSQQEEDWEFVESISTSFLKPVIWLKLPPLNAGSVIEFPQMVDKIRLYERANSSEDWHVQVGGDTLPVSKRPMKTAEMALQLSDFQDSETERFIRLEQPSSVTHSINNWTSKAFDESTQERFLVQLLLFGFCGAMVLFNFIVSIVSREKIFAFNAATISCTILIAIYLTGQGGFRIWPESPQWSYITLVLAMGGLSLFATQFISAFLENSSVNPQLLTFNRWFGAAQFTTSVLVLLSGQNWLYAALLLVGLFSMGFQLFLVFSSIAKGDRQSLPILIPLSILIAGIVIRWGRTAFALDLGWANYHIMEIALAFEAMTFSLVLAARIRYLDIKASQTQAKLDQERIDSANRFSRLQDFERVRFAGDLHDSLGHSLAVINAQLGKVETERGLTEDIADRVAHCTIAVKDAISETRRISHDLHPAKLDHLGLKGTLRSMFEDLETLHAIKPHVTLDFPDAVFSYDDKMQIYRIVQEAISNIIRHSSAENCWLSLKWVNDNLSFELADDGCGLGDKGKVSDSEGLGLFSVSQRATQLGGEMHIKNREPRGLILALTLKRRLPSPNP